jgi:hypothetical protein
MSIPDELDGIHVNEPERPFPRIPSLTTALKNCPSEDDAAITPTYAYYLVAWFLAWLGTALAGSAFGLGVGVFAAGGEGLFIGPIAGGLIAGVFGAPIVATGGILTWLLWLGRYRRGAPAAAGACTGIVSTSMLFWSEGSELVLLLVVVAGVLGAAGGYLPAAQYWNKRVQIEQRIEASDDHTWQFSLRDLFARFTAASFLLAAWMFLFSKLLR